MITKELHDEGSAMAEWQRREMELARQEWAGFWSGLLIALFISFTVAAVVVCVVVGK